MHVIQTPFTNNKQRIWNGKNNGGIGFPVKNIQWKVVNWLEHVDQRHTYECLSQGLLDRFGEGLDWLNKKSSHQDVCVKLSPTAKPLFLPTVNKAYDSIGKMCPIFSTITPDLQSDLRYFKVEHRKSVSGARERVSKAALEILLFAKNIFFGDQSQ